LSSAFGEPWWSLTDHGDESKLLTARFEQLYPSLKAVVPGIISRNATTAVGAPALPEGYAGAAKAVAEKQAALASYRLADVISRVLH